MKIAYLWGFTLFAKYCRQRTSGTNRQTDIVLDMRKLSFTIATLESVALGVYAVSILITANQAKSKVGSPIIETIIYLVFAILIFLCARGTWNGKDWAKTPTLLIQAFMLIVAYTLFSGTAAIYKAIGILVAVVAVVGFVATLKISTSR